MPRNRWFSNAKKMGSVWRVDNFIGRMIDPIPRVDIFFGLIVDLDPRVGNVPTGSSKPDRWSRQSHSPPRMAIVRHSPSWEAAAQPHEADSDTSPVLASEPSAMRHDSSPELTDCYSVLEVLCESRRKQVLQARKSLNPASILFHLFFFFSEHRKSCL